MLYGKCMATKQWPRFGSLPTEPFKSYLFLLLKKSSVMRPFKYSTAPDATTAIGLVSANPTAKYLGGGTNLVDLMKEDVMRPAELMDVSRLKYAKIEKKGDGVSIGA